MTTFPFAARGASRNSGPPEAEVQDLQRLFFQEARENLEAFEAQLLALPQDIASDEALNALFRCAHSVKGAAAAFGFEEVTLLTHAMETLLDRLRRRELALAPQWVDTLLGAGDMLGTLLSARERGLPPPDASEWIAALRSAEVDGQLLADASPAAARDLELVAGPGPASLAEDLEQLFREVGGSGTVEPVVGRAGLPPGTVRLRLRTSASDAEIVDLCSFHVDRDRIAITEWPVEAAPVARPTQSNPAPVTSALPVPAETLRVSVEKVDQLINLVGELVITQALLRQAGSRPGESGSLAGGLADLERTTRALQDSVMAIRMIPMSHVFSRFPRMLRELAGRLGRQVELQAIGGATELDKGMIEKIIDPLTHLVRNAVDHGLEPPTERVAAGKPPQGTLSLSARHEGGCVLIEVRDDGRGLDRVRILDKARRQGLTVPDHPADADVWRLVFTPGFSTASEVTEVSGRGVGMDVVRRNIQSLGGSVEIESAGGRGTLVRIRLPLTLAIMDGMSVSAAGECFVLPLGSVVEAMQVPTGDVHCMGRQRVLRARGEIVPVVSLARAMGLPDAGPEGILVIVRAEGRLAALAVDALVGQQQVVVKNLEANCGHVPNVSSATIQGDGRVALILDVAALARWAPTPPASSWLQVCRQTGELREPTESSCAL